MKWSGEFCKKCGREQRIAWSVTNSVWFRVIPLLYNNQVICLECFLKYCDKNKINISKTDFLFFGMIGDSFKGVILIDK